MSKIFAPRVNLDNLTIISGGATGADELAGCWAKINNINFEEHKADWAKYGNRAGTIRNKVMLDSKLDFLISFPGGTGTNNMRKICKDAGVSVITADKFRDGYGFEPIVHNC